MLNQRSFVKSETVLKVEKSIRELGYVQNNIAKSLALKNSKHIGILVYEINNPYYFEIYEGMEKCATENGYIITLFNLSSNFDEKLKAICERNLSGIVSFMSNYFFSSYLNVLKKQNIVMVNFDSEESLQVEIDYSAAMYKYIEMLSRNGHKNLGYIYNSAKEKFFNVDTRGKSFVESCNKLGLNYKDCIKFPKDPNEKSHIIGYNLAKELLTENKDITALFCVNDFCAYGAVSAINEMSLKCPEDISVIGCDDILFSNFFQPKLSSVTFDKIKLGEEIVRRIILQVNDKEKAKNLERKITMTAEPVLRESVTLCTKK